MVLKIDHLVGGNSQIPVLKDINFEVHEGELVGLIGLNGAGKSTTINHIIGLLTPQKGRITIDGKTVYQDSDAYKKQIAYIPELPVLYPELTLKEHINLTIMAYRLDAARAWQRATELLKTFRLANKLDWFPDNFSKGMKQKVMIVCAFLTDAKLYIIDEPFLGLDPLATDDLLKLINDRKSHGAAVLMSTHVLDTAEKYCDRFILLHSGKIQTQGDLASLRKQNPTLGQSLTDIYLGLAREGESHD